jgi:hypothetical protein
MTAAALEPATTAGGALERRQREVLAAAIARSDYFRGRSLSAPGVPGYKEWTYFCVAAPQGDLLLTFGLTERIGPARRGEAVGRLIALLRDRDGAWFGDADEIRAADVDARHGRIDLRLGESAVRFARGGYDVDARLASGEVAARLRFEPLALPTIGTSVRLGACEAMRWVVVPRLAASGEISIAGRRTAVDAAPAYHDHNWGTFIWGTDFAWEWAAIPPSRPDARFSFVYSRISDRARGRTLSQAILVWRDDESCRIFRDEELRVESEGLLRGGSRLRIPRVMRLVEPGHTADMPRRITARATRGSDRIELCLDLRDYAEIAVPNEDGLATTLLCEARASVEIHGTIRGESFAESGAAIFELNHGAGTTDWGADPAARSEA